MGAPQLAHSVTTEDFTSSSLSVPSQWGQYIIFLSGWYTTLPPQFLHL